MYCVALDEMGFYHIYIYIYIHIHTYILCDIFVLGLDVALDLRTINRQCTKKCTTLMGEFKIPRFAQDSGSILGSQQSSSTTTNQESRFQEFHQRVLCKCWDLGILGRPTQCCLAWTY